MFGFGKKLIEEPPKCAECEKLSAEIEQLTTELNEIKARDTAEKESVFDDVVVDFKQMDAFSIERETDSITGAPHTVIGYLIKNGDNSVSVEQWYLTISNKKHKELVEQFKNYIIKKYS